MKEYIDIDGWIFDTICEDRRSQWKRACDMAEIHNSEWRGIDPG